MPELVGSGSRAGGCNTAGNKRAHALRPQAMFALKTSCENFDNCVFPNAMIAVMGPEAAVNAVYFNKLQGLSDEQRAAEESKLREEYRQDVDIEHLASELVVDAVVPPARLREEIAGRAVVMAEEMIKKNLQDVDQEKIIENYLSKVGRVQ